MVLVLSARQAITHPNSDAYAAVVMAAAALIVSVGFTPPKPAADSLEATVHVLFDDAEDADDADDAPPA